MNITIRLSYLIGQRDHTVAASSKDMTRIKGTVVQALADLILPKEFERLRRAVVCKN